MAFNTSDFSEREQKVLALMAHQGLSYAQVAEETGSTVSAVRQCLSRMLDKTGAQSCLQLVVWYWRARMKAIGHA